jgi:hypothetical protein
MFKKILFVILLTALCCCTEQPKKLPKRYKSEIITNNDSLVFIGKNNLHLVIIKSSEQKSGMNSWNLMLNDTSRYELKNVSNDSLWNFVQFELKKLKYEKPCNPKLIFDGKTLVFQPQKDGSEIDWYKLKILFIDQLSQPFKIVDLIKKEVYKTAKFKIEDKKCAEILSIAKRKSELKLTFTSDNQKFELTGLGLTKLLITDENMSLQLNEGRLYSYLNAIAKNVDRIQSPISFIDASNTSRTISTSEIGKRLHIQKMMQEVNKNFNANTSFEKEVIYLLNGVPTNSLTTNRNYIEVNLSAQKVFFFKNDSVVLSSDIVTGKNGMSTPKGAFFIKYKETNTYLDGPGYHCYVRYFMPIYNGIGLHDASWRRSFGGNIYAGSGSHGCINLPPPVAAFAFNNYAVGTVVICH